MIMVYIAAILVVVLVIAAVYDRRHRGGTVRYGDHVANPGKDLSYAITPPTDIGGGF
ncbi:hypothetical protein [Janibacter melonis]|uniref:hypothetical protein n=1 Tax=Janibacter melonis TaxID=262209 RepID=UPI001918F7A2|nr:hypothetical protein [Janibacter melonis]